MIDVRTPVEYREVHAEPARLVPLDRLDPRAFMDSRDGSKDHPLYIICRSGSRGRQAVEKFHAAGYTNVANVEGGTLAWEKAGLPVVRGQEVMSLERQVRIAAGSLVVIGTGHGGVRASGLPRPGRLRGGGTGLRRGHGLMRDGDDPGEDALESGLREGGRSMKLVIVGGVAGGASAATRARRLSEEANIVVFERGPDVSFANCGLPYYVGGEIEDRDKLLVVTPERMRERYKLDVRVRTSVESIDRNAKTIRAR